MFSSINLSFAVSFMWVPQTTYKFCNQFFSEQLKCVDIRVKIIEVINESKSRNKVIVYFLKSKQK